MNLPENQLVFELRKRQRPNVSINTAIAILREHWNISIEVNQIAVLDSYDDNNFYIKTKDKKYTLKIQNGVDSESQEFLGAQTALPLFLRERGINVPCPIQSTKGEYYVFINLPVLSEEIKELCVRLVDWVEGTPMINGCDLSLIEKSGRFLGLLQDTMQGFDHPGFQRNHLWDSQKSLELLPLLIDAIPNDGEKRELISSVIAAFRREIGLAQNSLRKCVIMNDYNDANIILYGGEVNGVVDFGDVVYSWFVNEVAVGLTYAMLSFVGKTNPLLAGVLFLRGYFEMTELTHEEKSMLRLLVSIRLCLSLSIGAYSMQKNPENLEYLSVHTKPAWKVLDLIWNKLGQEDFDKFLIGHATENFQEFSESKVRHLEAELLASFGFFEDDHVSNQNEQSKLSTHQPENQAIIISVKFITENKDVSQEFQTLLQSEIKEHKVKFDLQSEEIDLPEVQGEPEEVAREKCRFAVEYFKQAVLIQDTSLCFNALNGLPGPYANSFLKQIGSQGLCNILSAYKDKSAYAQCIFAFCSGPGHDIKLFIGSTDGVIVSSPNSSNTSFDTIFQPHGFQNAFADLPPDTQKHMSHEFKAFNQFKSYLLRLFPV